MRIDPMVLDTADPSELDAWHELCVASYRVDVPGEPDPPRSATVGMLVPDEDRRLWWLARSGGRLVGGAALILPSFENSHFAEFYIQVRPADRRSGFGRALFERVRDTAVREGRTELETWVHDGTAGAAFAEAMGMRPSLSEVRRVLYLSDVDSDAVARWAAGSEARTDGFQIIRWIYHCPDEWLDAYAAARNGMNDTPTGTMDWRPAFMTGERMRAREKASIRRGAHRYAVAVAETSTGAIAGVSEMFVSPDSPRAEQGVTTVLRPYRGRGFGLWAKANMIQWLSDVEPRVTEHETWNAAENRYMIAVNERLGYRVVGTGHAWRLPIG